LYGRETGEEWQNNHCGEDDCLDKEDWEIAGATALLPSAVQEWAGLQSEDPIVNGLSLSDWNDSEGRDFEAIADLIEEAL
jgi:hypothetical protein